jgi:acetyl esterase/lipase
MKRSCLGFLLIATCLMLPAQEAAYVSIENIPYYPESETADDEYQRERGVLDLYYPAEQKGFPTVVWFHGGGLTGGNKFIPDELKEQGMAVVAPNYRLYPKVNAPVYIEDAAAAVAWVFRHMEEYGGDPELIFISGHSAGGYLTSMVGLDPGWLKKHQVDANQIAGLIPFSGHTITHFTVRRERGIEGTRPVVDELAPLYHVRKDAPPLLLITGDREMEMMGRYEENAYMMRMMKVVGHPNTRLYEMDGYGHNMLTPAYPLLINEVRRIESLKK